MPQIILSSLAIILTVAFSILLFVRRDRSLASTLLVYLMLTATGLEFFDLLALLQPDNFLFWKKFSLTAEGFLPLQALFFSLTYARKHNFGSFSIGERILVVSSAVFPLVAMLFPVTSFFYSPDFGAERMLFLGNTAYVYYIVFTLFLIMAMVNLETTLAGATHGARWAIKFDLLGVGALLAVLAFYYSQGLLYRSLNMNLLPLRSVALITATGMITYSHLWRGREVRVTISRQMAFRSVVLLIIGIYLISLGLLGEGMKYFGDPFKRSLFMAIGFIVGIGLLVMILSETVKRKLKVFLHKNFYRQKFDYKTQWLDFTDRLTSAKSRDDLLRSIVSGFCETFGMGCGVLFLRDYECEHFQSAAVLGTEISPILFSIGEPLPEFMSTHKWVVHILEQNLEVSDEQQKFLSSLSATFAVPLFLAERLEGFILLGRSLNSNETYNYEDHDLMKTLACQSASAILNLQLSDQLYRAREMGAIGKLSTFMLHDLKNLVTTLSLVVDNAKQFIDNPEFQVDMLESLAGTVAKMNELILKLKNLQDKGSSRRQPADLLQIADSVARQVVGGEIKISGSQVFHEVDIEEINKLLLNLILNALEASGGGGPVSLEVGGDDTVYIRVSDEGCGMTEDFIRKSLFKPFQTTKAKGLGIGLYQCKQIVESHGGTIAVTSKVGVGTTFTVFLPRKGACNEQRVA
ncbi:MAG: XrtA/PEP-CTERM system histidine kinase PrsK [Deltaproteobacteria bacterium]